MSIELLVATFMVISIVCGIIVFLKPKYLKDFEGQEGEPVSIIIPAKNEAMHLPKIIESIQNQSVSCEIIVVNDHSTDETTHILKNYNVKEVILQENLWHGKSYVCYEGCKHATNDYILFMDADVYFTDTDAVRRILRAYQVQNNQGVLSVQPYHITKKWYERLSAVFNLVTVMGINQFSGISSRREASMIFGPIMFTTQADYQKTGGHMSAKNNIIEGQGIFDAYQAQHLPIRLYLAKGIIGMRIYPNGLKQLIEGWTKHIAEGSTRTHPVHMSMIILYLGGGATAFFFLITSLFSSWSVVLSGSLYVLYGVIFYLLANRVIQLNILDVLFYPIYIIFFFYVYGLSWYKINIKREVVWKGKTISLKHHKK